MQVQVAYTVIVQPVFKESENVTSPIQLYAATKGVMNHSFTLIVQYTK